MQHHRPGPARVATVCIGLVVASGLVLTGCGTDPGEHEHPSTSTSAIPAPEVSPGAIRDPTDPQLSLDRDPARKHRAAELTSTFENSTLELQYGFAQNIGDRKGITAGRAGFTSGTGDLLMFVRRYSELKPDNPLARYLPALEAVNGTASTAGLDGFIGAWAVSAQDPDQRRLQDELVDELYFTPAMDLAAQAGVRTPLGQAILWDTMIQHGAGGEDGTRAILEDTAATAGDPGQDEAAWLEVFLDVRLHHLDHAYKNTTATAEESSQSRINALRSILREGNLALEPPMRWEVYGDTFTLNE